MVPPKAKQDKVYVVDSSIILDLMYCGLLEVFIHAFVICIPSRQYKELQPLMKKLLWQKLGKYVVPPDDSVFTVVNAVIDSGDDVVSNSDELSDADVIIIATALAKGYCLATRDDRMAQTAGTLGVIVLGLAAVFRLMEQAGAISMADMTKAVKELEATPGRYVPTDTLRDQFGLPKRVKRA